MNNTLSKIVIFAAGAAIGSAVTWKLLYNKYEQRLEEDINSYKEARSRRDRMETEECDVQEEDPAMTRAQYEELIKSSGYDTQSEIEEDVGEAYVISPDEFDEFDDYTTVSLTYYEDGVLTDDNGEIVEDIVGTVGKNFTRHFGDYEEDAVHIRNDSRKCDYEILQDSRRYSDIKPRRTEV